jgi:carbamoyl-phosphate synthase large subunit
MLPTASVRSSRQPLTVGVTGLNAGDSPGPGVAVIRALLESPDYDVRVVGLCYEALEPGVYIPGFIGKTYQLPYPTAGTTALLERLRYIHEREGLDVLIPNFDAELYNFIRLASQLRGLGIHTFLPSEAQLQMRDKLNLSAFGSAHGFRMPAARALYQAHELAGAAAELGWPLVVKGKFYEATVAHSLAQAEQAFHQLHARWGLPIIAQQFVAGQEINIAGLADGAGRSLSLVPMRKLSITDKGKAWAGITLEDETLLALGRRFALSTGWRGGFELEVIRTAAGELMVLEINPRFPAWIYLTAAAGQNQPAALLRLALGHSVAPMKTYTVGKMFVRYAWDAITDYTTFQQIAALGEV